MNFLSTLVTPRTVFALLDNGKSYSANDTHPAFDEIKAAIADGDADALPALFDMGKAINLRSGGSIVVRDGVIYIDGEQVVGAIEERIFEKLDNGGDINALVEFQRKLMLNPSFRVREQLYEFIERGAQIGIADNGNIMAFKIVRKDDYGFVSHYDASVRHDVGTYVTMDRTKVDDDPNRTCSAGLHACSEGYLRHYGGGPDSYVVVVEINPVDVVSIPTDYNAAKMRCCRYLVKAVVGPRDEVVENTPDLDLSMEG